VKAGFGGWYAAQSIFMRLARALSSGRRCLSASARACASATLRYSARTVATYGPLASGDSRLETTPTARLASVT
jgi:hypothetical protein